MIQKKRAERFNNYFSSVFKIDNGEPSHEDYLLSDFDGDALSNISISPADVKETSGTSESWQILGTGHDISSSIEGVCKFYFLSVVYLFKTNHLVVVSCFPKLWKVTNLAPGFKSDDKRNRG